ncbi:hypothetical protein ABIB06_004060 [Bradyrhizobium sp. LB8.2]|uniref:hypothetical protein n=1 Tax=Bradyrhizobium sp. LB8.2 TaxID=3156330 RepID=UPI0033958032
MVAEKRKRNVAAIIAEMGAIQPSTPLRLDIAAHLAFPDGSMSVSALRRLVVAGKLTHEFFAGKYFVTLAAIDEFREASRIRAIGAHQPTRKPERAEQFGEGSAEDAGIALAAMNATANRLLQELRNGPPDGEKAKANRKPRRTISYRGKMS